MSTEGFIDVGDVVSATLGFVALGISWWQVRRSDTHAKLNVRPYLSITRSKNEQDALIRVTVKNCGLGPAIISAYGMTVNNEKVSVSQMEHFQNVLKSAGVVGMKVDQGSFLPGDVISSNDEMMLLIVNKARFEEGQDLDSFMRRVNFCIDYRSVHGDHFKLKANGASGF